MPARLFLRGLFPSFPQARSLTEELLRFDRLLLGADLAARGVRDLLELGHRGNVVGLAPDRVDVLWLRQARGARARVGGVGGAEKGVGR